MDFSGFLGDRERSDRLNDRPICLAIAALEAIVSCGGDRIVSSIGIPLQLNFRHQKICESFSCPHR